MKNTVKIVGTGSYLPGEPIPFDRIDEVLGELTEAPKRVKKWVVEMKPIMKQMLDLKMYHYALDPATGTFTDNNISMATKASLKAIEAAGLATSDIDLICYGAGYMLQMPPTSVRIQEALGIESCSEFAIQANCTSAYKALFIATEMIKSGCYETALVVSSQVSSAFLNSGYFNQQKLTRETAFLRWFLCDGAGALILTSKDVAVPYVSVENNYLESIGGKRASMMYNNAGANPVNPLEEYNNALHHVSQTFQNVLASEVFKDDKIKGKSIIFAGIKRMFDKFSLDPSAIKYLQINLPNKNAVEIIFDELSSMNLDRSILYTKQDKFGYSGPPTVFICIDEIFKKEPLKDGDLVVSFVTEVSKFMQAGFTLKACGDISN